MPKYLLILICILFLFTRLYKISEIPPSVYWDEASIGFNAYSIAESGYDEWGQFLPIHFRAFGEFKLPVYIYTVALFVKTFGLNELSIRLPAVLYGLGVVIITYFLAKKLTDSFMVGLLSSFFVSISPWFFIFSRAGYEATAGLMFYLLAVYYFLSHGKSRYIFFSSMCFILSIYSYNSFRIISPLTMLILFLSEFRNLMLFTKKGQALLIFSLILIGLSMIPIYRLYIYDAGLSRLNAVSSLNSGTFLSNYLSHYSLDFLLAGDKNLRSQQSGFGQLYFTELLLIPLGLLYIISRKTKVNLLTLLLILIAPIPAAITKESPHALRAIAAVPFISILSAIGVLYLKKKFSRQVFLESVIVLIYLVFFTKYFINFYDTYPIYSSADWHYGYKRVYLDYKDQFAKYKRVIISDEYGQPYIFGLFYLKINPKLFRDDVVRNDISNWGFSTVAKFGKFEFGKVNKLLEKGDPTNVLIFASKKDNIPGLEPISQVMFLDGTTAFLVYTQ